VSKIFREGDKTVVWGTDTLTGQNVEIAADLVVLATAMAPRPEGKLTAQMLNLSTDENGWILPADDNVRPVETLQSGIFVAGVASGPKDIPETVAQASGAAGKVLSLFARWGHEQMAKGQPETSLESILIE
jgi:heterodisulfide reductase subunit A